MSVDQLGRVTFRLTGYGFNPQLVDVFGGLGRKHHRKAQPAEEHCPEGVVLVHIQNPGNTDNPSWGKIRGQRLIVKHPVIFVVKKVGNLFSGFFPAKPPLAAISADILAASPETIDCQDAVVGAALAAGHGGVVLEGNDFV